MGTAVVVAAVVAMAGLSALALLVLVVAGIHGEERRMSLTGAPRTRAAAVTRRVLGVCVRVPGACHGNDQVLPGSDLP